MVVFGNSGNSEHHFASTHWPSQAGPSRDDPPRFREKPLANRKPRTTASEKSLADMLTRLKTSSAGSKSEAGTKRKSCCLGLGLGSMFSVKRLKLDGNGLKADVTSVRTEWVR